VRGPLNSLVWYVPSLRYTRGLGWHMHCGAEVTESSTNKQHHLSGSQFKHHWYVHPVCKRTEPAAVSENPRTKPQYHASRHGDETSTLPVHGVHGRIGSVHGALIHQGKGTKQRWLSIFASIRGIHTKSSLVIPINICFASNTLVHTNCSNVNTNVV
jgi:hypothetical protein